MADESKPPIALAKARPAFARAIGLALLLSGAASAAAQAGPREQPEAAATAMPALSTAEIDETLAIGGEEIDARKLRSRMTVEVMVNQTGPHRFVVDSGADTSVVGQRIASALRLPAGRPVMLNSMTSSSVVDRVLVDQLQLGPTVIRDLQLPVLKEINIGAAGMIGLDALIEQRLMLDFEKRIITIDDASSPMPKFDGEIVVIARLSRGQLILTEVTANKLQVDAVIDTGSEITIGNIALREQLMRKRPDEFSTVEMTGVTGVKAYLELARITEMRVGPIVLRNVVIAFADVPPFAVFGLSDEPALLLGTDLMEHFRKVSLDFDARRVRFQLKKCERSTFTIRIAPRYASRLSADRPSACAQ